MMYVNINKKNTMKNIEKLKNEKLPLSYMIMDEGILYHFDNLENIPIYFTSNAELLTLRLEYASEGFTKHKIISRLLYKE